MPRPPLRRAYGMQRCSSLVAGVAALLVLACRGSEGTPPESPQGSGGTHLAGTAPTVDTTAAGATTDTRGGMGSSMAMAMAGPTVGTATNGSAPGSTGSESSGTPSSSAGGMLPIGEEGCGKVTVDASAVDHAAPGRIVVLGSSTAAGQNASSSDKAWVARYQAYLAEEFPNFAIENLAMGGFNTYRIQASDYVPPAGRPAPIPGNNISAALEKDPDGVIINLPSNDEYEGFSLDEQMDNYERVAQLAQANGVLVWVATPQPRDFAEAEQRQSLMDARDAIQERFAPRAIDFWTDLANPDGTMESNYNSGDGTHFNDAGHAILTQRVITCAIAEVLSSSGD